MNRRTRLSVNINKVATLRNARGEGVPNVVAFARHCQEHGAEGITVHPRPDERHITLKDVEDLRPVLDVEFNIEGNPDARFMRICETWRPDQATLVPDKPEVLTSCAGWDVKAHRAFLADVVRQLKEWGIRVSIFVSPDEEQIREAAAIGADRVELYTKPYADGYEESPDAAVMPYVMASEVAHAAGLGVNAGHDLNSKNLRYFAQSLPYLDEVSIGHAIISEALYEGIDKVLKRYRECLSEK